MSCFELSAQEPPRAAEPAPPPERKSDELSELKSQMEAMRRQLAELARERK